MQYIVIYVKLKRIIYFTVWLKEKLRKSLIQVKQTEKKKIFKMQSPFWVIEISTLFAGKLLLKKQQQRLGISLFIFIYYQGLWLVTNQWQTNMITWNVACCNYETSKKIVFFSFTIIMILILHIFWILSRTFLKVYNVIFYCL